MPRNTRALAGRGLGEAITAFKRAYPEPRDADDATVLNRLTKAKALAAKDDVPKDDDEEKAQVEARAALMAFAAIHKRFDQGGEPPITLIGVLGRAVKAKRRTAQRKAEEDAAELVIDRAITGLEAIRLFIEQLEREAAAEDKTYWLDYDVEPMDLLGYGWGEKVEAALSTLTEIVRIRRDWGLGRLENLRLTQKQNPKKPTKKPTNFATLAALRDLVNHLARYSKRPAIADLATVVFGEKITVEQVRQAAMEVARQKAKAAAERRAGHS
jgi:hypothetical protein